MRSSPDCRDFNRPRMLGGLPWEMAIGSIAILAMMGASTRNIWLPLIGGVPLLFLNGAGKRDPLFLFIYKKHINQANSYSPAPVSRKPMNGYRPLGYGRSDPH